MNWCGPVHDVIGNVDMSSVSCTARGIHVSDAWRLILLGFDMSLVSDARRLILLEFDMFPTCCMYSNASMATRTTQKTVQVKQSMFGQRLGEQRSSRSKLNRNGCEYRRLFWKKKDLPVP